MNIDYIISSTVICSKEYKSQLVKIVSDIFNQDISKYQKINLIKSKLESQLRFNSLEGILKRLF